MLSRRGTLLVSLITLLLFANSAWAASACVDLFKPHPVVIAMAEAKALEEKFVITQRAYRQGLLGRSQFERDLAASGGKLTRLFATRGLTVEFREEGFEILPQGSHSLAKVASHLNSNNIRLMYAPHLLPEGMQAAYSVKESDLSRTLYIDLETIIHGRIGVVGAHELRHVYNDLRANERAGAYERLFQTHLFADKTASKKLPEIEGPYQTNFSLDEIIAYRLSAALLLRDLMRHPSDNFAKNNLIVHGEQLRMFVNSGLATLKVLLSEVQNSRFTFTIRGVPGAETAKVQVEIVKAGLLKNLFSTRRQDKNLVGLIARLDVLRTEVPSVPTPDNMRLLLSTKIGQMIVELEALQKPAHSFFEATQSLAGKHVSEAQIVDIDEALGRLSRAIAARRMSHNNQTTPTAQNGNDEVFL